MKRRIFAVALILLLCVTAGAFAKEKKSSTYPWMASYDVPGQLNVYASVGFYGLGIDLNAGPEMIFGNFDIAGIPFEWGATVRGLVGFASYFGYASWIDWGVAPMATLHWGVDFGGPWKFDWYVGLGVGISGTTTTYTGYGTAGAVGFGLASCDGVVWHFSDHFGLIADYAYTGYVSAGDIGVQWKL